MFFLFILCTIFLILQLSRENFFKDCGEVVDVRLATDDTGRFKGFGHVEFATAEAAQNVSFCTLYNPWKSFSQYPKYSSEK